MASALSVQYIKGPTSCTCEGIILFYYHRFFGFQERTHPLWAYVHCMGALGTNAPPPLAVANSLVGNILFLCSRNNSDIHISISNLLIGQHQPVSRKRLPLWHSQKVRLGNCTIKMCFFGNC